jgi:hypothetical protein
MDGDVACRPVPAEGSEFVFTWPCQVAAPPPAPAAAAPGVAAVDTSPSKGRVLLAEDSPVNALIAGARLERMGLEVEVVENGQEAVERLQMGVLRRR